MGMHRALVWTSCLTVALAAGIGTIVATTSHPTSTTFTVKSGGAPDYITVIGTRPSLRNLQTIPIGTQLSLGCKVLAGNGTPNKVNVGWIKGTNWNQTFVPLSDLDGNPSGVPICSSNNYDGLG